MEKKKINPKIVIRNVLVILLIVIVLYFIFRQKDKNLKVIQKTKIASPSGEQEVQDMLLASGENQVVINLGDACWMFFEFGEEKVSSVKYYYEYATEAEAKEAVKSYFSKGETSVMHHDKVEEVKQEGKYMVIIPDVSSYQDTTKQEVLDTYTLLQELYQPSESLD